MTKIVVVDDEKLVLHGIHSYIADASDFYEVTGLFTDAQEALAFCRTNRPDVVLTDIRMPGMDGLQLIGALKSEMPSVKILVLSCHNDFHYVRSAFLLGADDYILKHELEKDDLLSLLDRFSDRDVMVRAKRVASGRDFRDAGRLFAPFPEMIPSSTGMGIRATLAGRALRLQVEPLLVAVIMFRDEYNEQYRLIPWSHDRMLLTRIVQDILDTRAFGEAFAFDTRELLCLFEFPDGARPSKHRGLEELLGRVLTTVSRYCNRRAFVGIAESPLPLERMGQGYASAVSAGEHRFYHQEGQLLFADSLKARQEAEELQWEARFQERHPLRLLPDQTVTETAAAIERYCAAVESYQLLRPKIVRCTVTRALREYLDHLQSATSHAVDHIAAMEGADLMEIISRTDSLQMLRQTATALLERVREFRYRERKLESFAGRVRAYIEENYRSELTLTGLASRFHVTAGHFCDLFKREFGVSFVNWLNELRISKARELLSSTTRPIKEIAGLVGFRSPSYFCRVFKRHAGRSATEFRKRCQDGED